MTCGRRMTDLQQILGMASGRCTCQRRAVFALGLRRSGAIAGVNHNGENIRCELTWTCSMRMSGQLSTMMLHCAIEMDK